VTIYFENCLGACRDAAIDLPDGTGVSAIIDACRERWGGGRLIRLGKDLAWSKSTDVDQDWRGCCKDKIERKAAN
jgi:hypothetical protein